MRLAFAAAVARAHLIDGLAIRIVLEREVLPPDGGIVDGVVERDHTIERSSRFLLSLEDAREQCSDPDDRERAPDGDENDPAESEPRTPRCWCRTDVRIAHGLILERGHRPGARWDSPDPVAHVRVASDAGDRFDVPAGRAGGGDTNPWTRVRFGDTAGAVIYRLDDLGMAVPARVLRHSAIALGDAKRIGVVAGREVEGVPEAVHRFHGVLADEVV